MVELTEDAKQRAALIGQVRGLADVIADRWLGRKPVDPYLLREQRIVIEKLRKLGEAPGKAE
jgi:hypothetical protein